MKVLLLNPPKERNGGYILREECAVGSEPTNVLPSQIYLAASYLCSRGWDADPVDARSVKASMAGYDVAVVWVSILHSYFDDLSFLREAKAHGLRTVMVLNDPHEGFERETLEKNGFIDAAVRL